MANDIGIIDRPGGTGPWRARWTGDDGKRHSRHDFTSPDAARAFISAAQETPRPDCLVYRALDDDIPLGLYTTLQAAQAHADHHARHEGKEVLLEWLANTSGIPVAEVTVTKWSWEKPHELGDDEPLSLYATVAGKEYGTGYTILPLTLSAGFDPEAEG